MFHTQQESSQMPVESTATQHNCADTINFSQE